MKNPIRRLLCLGLLAATAWTARAADPAPPRTHEPAVKTGKVLLLDNEHVLEGNIAWVDGRYRIRHLVGETVFPAERVLFLCQSLEEAFRFMRARANLEDADERLRLANWCRQNGLHNQALDEVRAAVQLRPNHPDTRRLLSYLQHSAQSPPARPVPHPAPEPPPPPVDLTADSLSVFITKVQPILMNRCANCHATGRGGALRLTRVWGDGASNRTALEHNLAAVLREVNVAQPEASRLLTRALSDHARTGQAPLRGKQDRPYRTLEDWVVKTVADNPQLRENLPAEAAKPPVETVPVASAPPAVPWGVDRVPSPARVTPPDPRPAGPAAGPAPATGTPAPPPAPGSSPPAVPPAPGTPAPVPRPLGPDAGPRPAEDVVDPGEFNRMAHPEREAPAPTR